MSIPRLVIDTGLTVEEATRRLQASISAYHKMACLSPSGRVILPPRTEESLQEDLERELLAWDGDDFEEDLYDQFTK